MLFSPKFAQVSIAFFQACLIIMVVCTSPLLCYMVLAMTTSLSVPPAMTLCRFYILFLMFQGQLGFTGGILLYIAVPLQSFHLSQTLLQIFGLRALYSILLLHIQQVGLGWV